MWGCGQIVLHYALFILHYYRFAAVAELADAPDLGSGVNDVGVQVPSAAPRRGKPNGLPYFFQKYGVAFSDFRSFIPQNLLDFAEVYCALSIT